MFITRKKLNKIFESSTNDMEKQVNHILEQQNKHIDDLEEELDEERQRRIANSATLDGNERLAVPEDADLDTYFSDLSLNWRVKIRVDNNIHNFPADEELPINVFASPGSSKGIGFMFNGKCANHVVRYAGKDWYFVRYRDGGEIKSGWICEDALSVKPKITFDF